jgi:hypothetical protein
VIAAFVRTYNDRVDAQRRQDLVPYAARIVGTRGDVPDALPVAPPGARMPAH